MPKSSSPSPTITPMNPAIKTLAPNPNPNPNPNPSQALASQLEADLLHSYQQALLMDDDDDPEPEVAALHQTLNPTQALDHFIFRDPDDDEDEDEDEAAGADEEEEIEEERKPSLNPSSVDPPSDPNSNVIMPYIDPTPHVSSQFYTFNRDSHALMVRCILEGRAATTDEIQNATPREVLKSWRAVWKDRNEDTAYLTAWKRIQDKLQAHLDSGGNGLLYFKSNPSQCVSYVEQWQEIVNSLHADPDLLRHLGLKETVDRIKQSWTVGAKFYGIPESFIRICVSSCPICSGAASAGGRLSGGGGARSKRRRFEYTESFDVPARDVQRRLQQLAAKHKVVLCIRQKYIRYKPFMAEVKDYACHRAGEPSSASGSSSKKARVLKREPYQSKRCGCGFRIRAIVPIMNYNEKDKTFVYQEEGTAVFKLYAVHSGHEPGASDGNARIIHRMVGHKGGFDLDPEVYGVREDTEPESFVSLMKDETGTTHHSILLQQVQELRKETGLLEGKIARMPEELLGSLSHELADILHRLRSVGAAQHSEDALVVGDEDAAQWGNDRSHHLLDGHDRMFAKHSEIIDEEENDFDSALETIVPWDRLTEGCHGRKMLMRDSCKPNDKWLLKEDCGDFDEKSILNCGVEEDSKLIKPLRHDGTIVSDPTLVGMHVDGFYHDSTKWYDSPTELDPVADSRDAVAV
ncbi:uncharacterized protein A4U43_C10F1320 [Asparagus officinalis]|uniref:Uncharacterized protein n=1 Tax=Asparagus officinalis TaxID=4686 RepID=A0A5P1DZR3_ASPOF|nr:uncharacterized protein A4U43_C10F1320 [Asparagus officinalis]